MKFDALLDVLHKHHKLSTEEDDEKILKDQIELIRRISTFRFQNVNLCNDVFHLFTNMTEVLNELGENHFFFDLKKAKRVLQETMAYPEVVRYISHKFDVLEGTSNDDDTTKDDFDPSELEESVDTSVESNEMDVVLDKIDSLNSMMMIGTHLLLFIGTMNMILTVFVVSSPIFSAK